ncbi:MAG: phage holin family protein, partial [Gemmatimonadota bacterium]
MSEGTQGPATNLLRSLVQLGGTLLAVAQTRVELLTTELSEDLERGLRILLWAMVGLLAGILGLLLAGITVVIYFWDTHRMAAALGVTAVFLILSAIAGLAFRRQLRQKPRLLDATRA